MSSTSAEVRDVAVVRCHRADQDRAGGWCSTTIFMGAVHRIAAPQVPAVLDQEDGSGTGPLA